MVDPINFSISLIKVWLSFLICSSSRYLLKLTSWKMISSSISVDGKLQILEQMGFPFIGLASRKTK